MTPAFATILNGLVLVTLSLYGYLSSDTPSVTALIPAIFGLIFVISYPMMKKENKVVAHIVVVLTVLLIFALFKPLTGALDRGDQMATLRVGLMLAVSTVALVIYIRSFINARRKQA